MRGFGDREATGEVSICDGENDSGIAQAQQNGQRRDVGHDRAFDDLFQVTDTVAQLQDSVGFIWDLGQALRQ